MGRTYLHFIFLPSLIDVIPGYQCIRLGTSDIVAHYDMRPSTELVPIYLQTSGNVLTVEESSVHLAVGELSTLC